LTKIVAELIKAREIAEIVLQKDASFVEDLMLAPKHIVRGITILISKWVRFYLRNYPQRFSVRNADSQLNVSRYVYLYIKNLMSYPVAAYRYSQFQRGYDRNYDVVAETPNTLFHGTNTPSLPDIDRRGLDPALAGQCWTRSTPNTIYLTDSMLSAEFFARTAFFAHGGDPVILCINVKNFKERFVVHTNCGQVVQAFAMYRGFASREIIPPNLIRNRYILPQLPSLHKILVMLIEGDRTSA
jgi:hypothetical protein